MVSFTAVERTVVERLSTTGTNHSGDRQPRSRYSRRGGKVCARIVSGERWTASDLAWALTLVIVGGSIVGFAETTSTALEDVVSLPPWVPSALATLLMVAFPAAQAIRVVRAGSTEGLGPTAWILIMWSTIAWGTYGVVAADYYMLTANAVGAPFVVTVITRLFRDGRISRGILVRAVVAVAASMTVISLGGETAGFVALLSITVLISVSMLRAVIGDPSTAGLSLTSVGASILAQGFWVVYALTEGFPTILWHASVVIAVNTLVVAVARSRRRAS